MANSVGVFLVAAKLLLLVNLARPVCGHEGRAEELENIIHHSNSNLLHVVAGFNSMNDLSRRAHTSRYSSLTGRSQSDIAAKLNLYAAEHASVSHVVPCSDLTSLEVASIAHKLKLLADDGIRLSLPEADGRQVHADPEVASFFDSPRLHDLQCAETMKLWAHHIPTSAKNDPSVQLTLPAVPMFNEEELLDELYQGNKTLSCVAGHTVVDFGTLEDEDQGVGVTDWPHWPRKINFRAKAHGPYPFWQFGTDYVSGYVPQWNVSQTYAEIYGGVDLEVWHNTGIKATKFYHEKCMMDYVGYGEVGQGPCIGMQFGVFDRKNHPEEPKGKWLLFTANSSTKSSDGVFCCSATLEAGVGTSLGTINRKFTDNMKYVGKVDFHGYFYDGTAKQYALVMDVPPGRKLQGPSLPLEVWYETDMQDKPLRFAEIGRNSTFFNDYVLKSRDLPFIYEEMDPTSFSRNFSDSVFEIPEMCKAENLPQCAPGPQSRNGVDVS